MRIVLDTNVLVSALISRDGPLGRVLAAVRREGLTLVTSDERWFSPPRQCCAAGTHAVVRPPMVRCSMRSPRVVSASARLPQRRWNSHVRG